MRHVFPLISLLLLVLIGTANPCSAQQQVARLRPLQRGNATASWTQQGGVNVLVLRGTTGRSLLSSNIAGFVADSVPFNSIDFDLDGDVTFFVRGSFENIARRRENGLLQLEIHKVGRGFKHIDISAFNSFIFRGRERDIQVDRQSPILVTGVGKLRNIRVNGRQPTISTETLTNVPLDFRGTRVTLRPLWIGR